VSQLRHHTTWTTRVTIKHDRHASPYIQHYSYTSPTKHHTTWPTRGTLHSTLPIYTHCQSHIRHHTTWSPIQHGRQAISYIHHYTSTRPTNHLTFPFYIPIQSHIRHHTTLDVSHHLFFINKLKILNSNVLNAFYQHAFL
jgi:hypothetical protein